jgi:imidazolonepropionase-like amidohydrolase
VAITGESVVAIGADLGDAQAVYDASGCYVTPGFVNPYTL